MARRYQTYFYCYDHPVSGNEVQFSSTDPYITYGVYLEGQMMHYNDYNAAYQAAQAFEGRQLWIVPIRQL